MSLHDTGREVHDEPDHTVGTAPEFVDATAERPCTVCGAPKYCYFHIGTARALMVCRKIESDHPVPGLIEGGQGAGWYHEIDPARTTPTCAAKPKHVVADVAGANVKYVDELAKYRAFGDAPDEIMDLRVEVPAGSYRATFTGLGLTPEGTSYLALTVPEYDGAGRQIGILRRFYDPNAAGDKKKAVTGTGRGLAVPIGFGERARAQGVVYVVEGESDVVAMTVAGLCAIGTPGAGCGAGYLVEYLSAHAAGCRVVVVAESDRAGERGAAKIAGVLKGAGLEAAVVRLTDGAGDFEGATKDVRQWLTHVQHQGTTWAQRGAALAAVLAATEPGSQRNPGASTKGGDKKPPKDRAGRRKLRTVNMATLKGEPVEFLVPDVIPLGRAITWFGQGGTAKSTLSRDLIASVTTGRCALGCTYDEPVTGRVLLLSAEDDPRQTILPALLAAGADLSRVELVVGADRPEDPDTRERTITLAPADLDAIGDAIEDAPDTVLLVIDPVTSYIARTGVDDHRATELRSILDPLLKLATDKKIAVLMLAHANKNTKAHGSDRLAGSAAYRDASRCVYLFGVDPEDDDARAMTCVKKNVIGIREEAVVFTEIEAPPEVVARVLADPSMAALDERARGQVAKYLRVLRYNEARRIAADELTKPKTITPKVAEAEAWLDNFIGFGTHPVSEVATAAKAAGIGEKALDGAKALLKKQGVTVWREGGIGGVWWIGRARAQKVVHRQPVDPLDGLE